MEYSGTDGTFYVLRNQAIKFVTFVGVALVGVQRCGNSGRPKYPLRMLRVYATNDSAKYQIVGMLCLVHSRPLVIMEVSCSNYNYAHSRALRGAVPAHTCILCGYAAFTIT